MYVGDDTRTMTFVLREVMHLHTQKLPNWAESPVGMKNQEPGRILRLTASPLGAMIKKISVGDPAVTKYQVNALGMTASRWREIRYVGTRIQLVPLATTGRIDPDDISQTGDGVPTGSTLSPQGSIHPFDALNFVHWRRWTGGNFNVPAWSTADEDIPGSQSFYVDKCLRYDQEWLSDDRFNHIKLTDGMQFDSVPLRVDLETSALAGNTLFGYSTSMNMSPTRTAAYVYSGSATKTAAETYAAGFPIGAQFSSTGTAKEANFVYDPDLSAFFQPAGLIGVTAGKDYHEQGWLPNPFAGFTYKPMSTDTPITPGNDLYTIEGYLSQFPWFADRTTIDASQAYTYNEGSATGTEKYAIVPGFNLDYLINLCIERFIAPLAIIRLPSAYGTMFYWTGYMAHIFQLRKPYLTNSSWLVGRVEDMGHSPTPLTKFVGDNAVSPELTVVGTENLIQAIGPDPYGLAESPSVLTLADIAPHTVLHPEPWRIIGGTTPQIGTETGDKNGETPTTETEADQ